MSDSRAACLSRVFAMAQCLDVGPLTGNDN